MNELTPGASQKYVVGEPDQSGTTVTKAEASIRLGISLSTLGRRLGKGQIPGAYKAPGPDGIEWRIPVASLPTPGTVAPSVGVEVEALRSEVENLKKELLHANEIRDLQTSEIENYRTLLVSTMALLPKAIGTGQETRRSWFRRKKTSQDHA